MRKSLLAGFLLVGIILTGTLALMYIEGWDFLQALWATMETVYAVGYGEYIPKSIEGKIVILFLMVVGIGIVAYGFGTIVSVIMEGQLKNIVGRRNMEKAIAKLENHIIVCGAGRVGTQIIQRLRKEGVPFVVIDQNEDLINGLIAEKVLAIQGDATEDEILQKVGIERARGLVTALPGDAANVFVTLTSKGLNPGISVVARAERFQSEEKLRRAGADKVIAPSVIGGRRMAISILKPVSVDFVETLMHHGLEIEIEEIEISSQSPLVNKILKESGIKENTGSMVVAIQRDEQILSVPSAHEKIMAGDLLIVLGTRDQLGKLEKMAQGILA